MDTLYSVATETRAVPRFVADTQTLFQVKLAPLASPAAHEALKRLSLSNNAAIANEAMRLSAERCRLRRSVGGAL